MRHITAMAIAAIFATTTFTLPSIALGDSGGKTAGEMLATHSVEEISEKFETLNKAGIKALLTNLTNVQLGTVCEELEEVKVAKLLEYLDEERFLKLLSALDDDKIIIIMHNLPNKGDQWLRGLKDDETREKLLPLAKDSQLQPLLTPMSNKAVGDFLTENEDEGLSTRIVVALRENGGGSTIATKDCNCSSQVSRARKKGVKEGKEICSAAAAEKPKEICSTPQVDADSYKANTVTPIK